MAERCPHRGASMVYGIPEDGGLRCPYHGWKFSDEGVCLEQPAEPENSTFKHRVRIPRYPVQELGGLIWAYLGPAPRHSCRAWICSCATISSATSASPCAVQLAAVHGELDGPDPLRVAARLLRQLRLEEGREAAHRPPQAHLKIALRSVRVRHSQASTAGGRDGRLARLDGRTSDSVPEHPGGGRQ